MNNPIFSELVGKFNTNIIIKEIVPFGNGHINDTYLVTTSPAEAPDYMLQRKNHKIFKDVPGMMKNIVITTNNIRNKLIAYGEKEVDRKVMTYIPAKDGNLSLIHISEPTRLGMISYAVFCLKKKKKKN